MEQLDLSVAMIVRNEETRLTRCLASLPRQGEELVIVDTGSTDRTLEIAKAHGALTKSIAMPDDFAAARNVSLELCTRNWVLAIDADEVISAGSAEEIRRWLRSRRYAGYYFTRDNYNNDGCKLYRDRVLRLFRRDPAIYFTGIVHESVEETLRGQGGRALLLPISLQHYVGDFDREKSDYYLRLLRQALDCDPGNWALLDHQGCEYFRRSEYPAALHSFKKICEAGVEHAPAYANAGALLARYLEQPEAALPYLRVAVRLDPHDEESAFLLRGLSGEVLTR